MIELGCHSILAAIRYTTDAEYTQQVAVVTQMIEALALAPHNIHVYTGAPGVVETDMAANDNKSPAWNAIRRQSPLGRVATPEDVVHTVAYLAAPGAERLTDGIIDVNGASYLRT